MTFLGGDCVRRESAGSGGSSGGYEGGGAFMPGTERPDRNFAVRRKGEALMVRLEEDPVGQSLPRRLRRYRPASVRPRARRLMPRRHPPIIDVKKE